MDCTVLSNFLFRCIQLENQRIIVVLDLLMLKQMFINLRGLCTFQVLFISILKSASVGEKALEEELERDLIFGLLYSSRRELRACASRRQTEHSGL